MPVEFGLSLPFGPPPGQPHRFVDDIAASLPHLEDHFRSLWMTDHFFWDDEPTFEAWTAMAYLAARFPDMLIGPMVLGQSYRNPAMLAKMGATLQALSGGRFIMAIGAGWKEDEYRAYGFDFPSAGTRIEQLEDAVRIIRRMWQEPGQVSYQGKHYQVEDAYCEPKPDPIPPIIIGGGGRKTMRVAAQYADWWNIPDANFDHYAARTAILHEHCANIDRDPDSLRLTWFGRLAVAPTEAEARSLGGKWTPDNAFVGTPQQVVEQIRPFVELGVDYFMVEVLGLPNPDVAALVTEEVIPQVQAS